MIINYTNYELDLLARLMRSEALSEGELGMLMVGNVAINRCLANCLTFKNVNSINDVINQPNQFNGINNSLFNAVATTFEKRLAKRIIQGEYFFPASNALWFSAQKKNCKQTWFNQKLAGKYKKHCFYNPDFNICQKFH